MRLAINILDWRKGHNTYIVKLYKMIIFDYHCVGGCIGGDNHLLSGDPSVPLTLITNKSLSYKNTFFRVGGLCPAVGQ